MYNFKSKSIYKESKIIDISTNSNENAKLLNMDEINKIISTEQKNKHIPIKPIIPLPPPLEVAPKQPINTQNEIEEVRD